MRKLHIVSGAICSMNCRIDADGIHFVECVPAMVNARVQHHWTAAGAPEQNSVLCAPLMLKIHVAILSNKSRAENAEIFLY